MTDPKPYLSPNETADFLGVATQTLANWRVIGSGPRHRKIGRLIRYSRADLIAWIESFDPRFVSSR
jgi:predicted DNA-binding transcriptional regulator AlpA